VSKLNISLSRKSWGIGIVIVCTVNKDSEVVSSYKIAIREAKSMYKKLGELLK